MLLLLLCGLAALLSLYSIYLLYWYNSTNTDAEHAAAAPASLRFDCAAVGVHGQCYHNAPHLPCHVHALQTGQHGPPPLPHLRSHLRQLRQHCHNAW